MFYEYEGEEDQHSENCNFIYGNCDCQMSDLRYQKMTESEC